MNLLWAAIVLLIGAALYAPVTDVLEELYSNVIVSLPGVTAVDTAFWGMATYIVGVFIFVAVVYVLVGKRKGGNE